MSKVKQALEKLKANMLTQKDAHQAKSDNSLNPNACILWQGSANGLSEAIDIIDDTINENEG